MASEEGGARRSGAHLTDKGGGVNDVARGITGGGAARATEGKPGPANPANRANPAARPGRGEPKEGFGDTNGKPAATEPSATQPERGQRGTSSPDQNGKRLSGRLFGGDAALWIIIVALAIISLLVVYSSTASLAYVKAQGDTSFFMLNQLKFILLGFFAIFVIHRFNYQTYSRYTRLLFAFALILMGLTFFIGAETNEAARSLRVGGVTFQPADLLKVTLVMVLARELGKRQGDIKRSALLPVIPLNFKISDKQRIKNREILRSTTIPILLPIAASCGMIFISNFSTAALVFVSCLVMMFVGRVSGRQLWRLVRLALLTVAVAVAVMYAFDMGRSHVWVNRIKSFAGVESTHEMTAAEIAARQRNEHQVENAKIAIASGEVFGLGPGQSVQRSNLPLPFSDYAYAFIVEEYGMVGAMVVIALYLWLFFRTVVIFRRCEKSFPSLLVLGLGIMIVVQAFVSMMVAVGLFPVTGLPLPYISLGGSSVLFTSISLGMILGVSRQMQEKTINDKE